MREKLFLIDSCISPDSPLAEIEAWVEECRRMLARYPAHPQWEMELEMAQGILQRARRLQRGGEK